MQTSTTREQQQDKNDENEFGQPAAVNTQFTEVNHLEQEHKVVDLTISNVTPIQVAYDPQVNSNAPIYQQQDVASIDIS